MFDTNLWTRFTTNRGMREGDSIVIDFGTNRNITGMRLDTTDSRNGHARRFMLQVGNSSSGPWTNIYGDVGTHVTFAQFGTRNTRFVRLVNGTPSRGDWWSIGDLQFYGN